MMSFKKISWKSGGNGMDNNSGYFIYIFVVLFEKLCCIVDEQLIVFVGEQFVVLIVLFACVVIITRSFIIDLFDLVDSIKVCKYCLRRRRAR
jgi:hypothetical protein